MEEVIRNFCGLRFDDFTERSLSPKVILYLLTKLARGSKILELGSGKSTREFSKYFNIVSIEQNEHFLNQTKGQHIYAPIENGYFCKRDIDPIFERPFDAIIVDGPMAATHETRKIRLGFQSFISSLKGNPILVFDDIHRFWDFINFSIAFLKKHKKPVYIRDGAGLCGVLTGRSAGIRDYLIYTKRLLKILFGEFCAFPFLVIRKNAHQNPGAHITRYYMYNRLSKFRKKWPNESKVLSISHSDHLCKLMGFEKHQIVKADYPKHNILDLGFEDRFFDMIVSDQVLEHVEGNPARAIEESFRVAKPGGFVLHTSCFVNPIHDSVDCWRFSPQGLKVLVRKYGNIINVEGWGNFWVWFYIRLGFRFLTIPKARWNPLNWLANYNDKGWPIVTWVLAEKK